MSVSMVDSPENRTTKQYLDVDVPFALSPEWNSVLDIVFDKYSQEINIPFEQNNDVSEELLQFEAEQGLDNYYRSDFMFNDLEAQINHDGNSSSPISEGNGEVDQSQVDCFENQRKEAFSEDLPVDSSSAQQSSCDYNNYEAPKSETALFVDVPSCSFRAPISPSSIELGGLLCNGSIADVVKTRQRKAQSATKCSVNNTNETNVKKESLNQRKYESKSKHKKCKFRSSDDNDFLIDDNRNCVPSVDSDREASQYSVASDASSSMVKKITIKLSVPSHETKEHRSSSVSKKKKKKKKHKRAHSPHSKPEHGKLLSCISSNTEGVAYDLFAEPPNKNVPSNNFQQMQSNGVTSFLAMNHPFQLLTATIKQEATENGVAGQDLLHFNLLDRNESTCFSPLNTESIQDSLMVSQEVATSCSMKGDEFHTSYDNNDDASTTQYPQSGETYPYNSQGIATKNTNLCHLPDVPSPEINPVSLTLSDDAPNAVDEEDSNSSYWSSPSVYNQPDSNEPYDDDKATKKSIAIKKEPIEDNCSSDNAMTFFNDCDNDIDEPDVLNQDFCKNALWQLENENFYKELSSTLPLNNSQNSAENDVYANHQSEARVLLNIKKEVESTLCYNNEKIPKRNIRPLHFVSDETDSSLGEHTVPHLNENSKSTKLSIKHKKEMTTSTPTTKYILHKIEMLNENSIYSKCVECSVNDTSEGHCSEFSSSNNPYNVPNDTINYESLGAVSPNEKSHLSNKRSLLLDSTTPCVIPLNPVDVSKPADPRIFKHISDCSAHQSRLYKSLVYANDVYSMQIEQSDTEDGEIIGEQEHPLNSTNTKEAVPLTVQTISMPNHINEVSDTKRTDSSNINGIKVSKRLHNTLPSRYRLEDAHDKHGKSRDGMSPSLKSRRNRSTSRITKKQHCSDYKDDRVEASHVSRKKKRRSSSRSSSSSSSSSSSLINFGYDSYEASQKVREQSYLQPNTSIYASRDNSKYSGQSAESRSFKSSRYIDSSSDSDSSSWTSSSSEHDKRYTRHSSGSSRYLQYGKRKQSLSSRSRSRSPSPRYRRCFKDTVERRWQEQQRQIDERRVVYVGHIPDQYTFTDLKARFICFGPIQDVRIYHRRARHNDNYGFVTFKDKRDAYEAVEHGNDHLEPKFDISFGGRRRFCKQQYSDLDKANEELMESESCRIPKEDEPYEVLLKKAMLRAELLKKRR